ncbi:septal ring lytic transglycosylase RlpA family lipoprotein [Pedobacter yulinensis]|uniref:Probable endolytic peptidoglycan transglycosylase RlpA n=1 Tax=Pedobacter yulinensis TaxID=2126353 RepID=A0A2T3HJ43_9SPHI|nr:septal ring lytic transglycosylase RlpA family protein [Pedobacter yulinensis]PST82468.1 septal ring lytic transglycosylase RlpA family lipoprotein [Pedobacter yulinensis]
MKHALTVICLLFFALRPVSAQQADSAADRAATVKTGLATYYASRFEGHRTTSGQRYRAKKFTAAHRSLPFGTVVTVTNLSNGKTIDVTVNDRGPFTRRFIIDVSAAAAKALGFYRHGQARVQISYLHSR